MGLFNYRGSRGGLDKTGDLLEGGAYLKIQDQGYKILARDVEERTGQENFNSQAHEIKNWQYYDEIHYDHSLNHCTLL